MLELKLGWRNIWRNWRRSMFTVAAIMFATFMIVVMRGIQLGTYSANIRQALAMFSGYLQIQKEGNLDNPSLRKTFIAGDDLMDYLKNDPRIRGYAPRIMTECLIGNKNQSVGAAIVAIDPALEKNVSILASKVRQGSFVSDTHPDDIDIGIKMMENLRLAVGDTVIVLTSGYDGSMGNRKFRVAGALKFGVSQMDEMFVIMNIHAAADLLSLGARVSDVVISLNDLEDIDPVKSGLDDFLARHNSGESLTTHDWTELMPELKQTIEFDNISGIIYLGILLLIVAFTILNTVVMSITERFREFGVMLAIGTRNTLFVAAVFIETMIMAAGGIIAGMLAGYSVNEYIMTHPIELGGDTAKMYEEFGFIPKIFSTVEPSIFIFTAIAILAVVVAVYLLPAARLMKLKALKGIRYV